MRGAGEEEEGRVERGANDTTHARQRQVALLLAAQQQPCAHAASTRLERDEVAPLCTSSPAILTLRVSLLVQVMLPHPPPQRHPDGPGRLTPSGKPLPDPAQTCHRRCCPPRCPPRCLRPPTRPELATKATPL